MTKRATRAVGKLSLRTFEEENNEVNYPTKLHAVRRIFGVFNEYSATACGMKSDKDDGFFFPFLNLFVDSPAMCKACYEIVRKPRGKK